MQQPLHWTFYATVILLFCGSCGQCCGPGRGGGRRRSARRLTPLVFKQHIPNVAETTLGASGIVEGKVSRDDPKFHDLVPNYNKDIIFTDEEGTGADRLMTERCKERLNTLAISVMNQWPGVRLRVTEAWDEGLLHAPNSLHYEGRAVDLATSDKDVSKHGMLARLAVQAGFDWVYYESRSRIHCSVKSESTHPRKLGGCFPGEAQVETPGGRIPMRLLKEGDNVKVLDRYGKVTFSPVLMFLHQDQATRRSFLLVVTEKHTKSTYNSDKEDITTTTSRRTSTSSNNNSIRLTPSHLLFVIRKESYTELQLEKASSSFLVETNEISGEGTEEMEISSQDILDKGEIVLAGRINPGDFLISVKNSTGEIILDKVIDIQAVWLEGVFAPLTAEGTVFVDNIVASCYAVIDSQWIAHWAFLPVRLYYRLKDTALSVLSAIGVVPTVPQTLATTTVGLQQHSDDRLLSSSKHFSRENSTSNLYKFNTSKSKNHLNSDIQIHWYPKMLYTLARWILPGHLVYS